MGDRGNIIVKEGNSEVFLYTHWRGSDLPAILRKSLARGEDRWDDGQYLARIIFCDMLDGDIAGLGGFGISSTLGDGGTDITVNVDTKTVHFRDAATSFSGYIAAPVEPA